LEVDDAGLDAMDNRYLKLIASSFGGGPVGVETLAAALSEPRDAIEDIIEPYLIQQGFLQRTPRGRVLTPTPSGIWACRHPPATRCRCRCSTMTERAKPSQNVPRHAKRSTEKLLTLAALPFVNIRSRRTPPASTVFFISDLHTAWVTPFSTSRAPLRMRSAALSSIS